MKILTGRHVLPSLLLLTAACAEEGGLDAGPEDAGLTILDATARPDLGQTVDPLPEPTLATVTPRSGSETGGTRVTLRGTAFSEPALVYFGDAPATSVVVLDEASIACSTPPGPVGPVNVRVETQGGVAELANGFTYHRELRLDSVDPARVPDEGGVFVTLHGKGFDEHTLVYLDRKPLRGWRLVDAERMEGWVPALSPGRPEIRVMNRGAEVRRSDVLYVYGTPDARQLAPGHGPIAGGTTQELRGAGLTDAERAEVGGVGATGLLGPDDAHLSFVTPALPVGAHDVVISNPDAQGTLSGGYVAFDPADLTFKILGVTPNRVSTQGGEVLTVVGNGFTNTTQVAVGGRRLVVTAFGGNTLEVVIPAGLPAGPADVTIYRGATTLSLPGVVQVYTPVVVASVSPNAGPASGGTTVTIRGEGFTSEAVARIADVPLADQVVVSSTEITGRIVAGTHGPAEVAVATAATRGALAGGFSFSEPYELVRLEPEEGSIAGNTYISAFGRGFDGEVGATLGGVEAVDPHLENGGILAFRAPPAPTGVVDVQLQLSGRTEDLFSGYAYYDPRLITGGAWGGPIEGSVNVAVMTFDRSPIVGMVVQLGYDADLRYTAITDENGLATISSPEIRGAHTVTAGGKEVEFVTFHEINARNLSMFATPFPQNQPPDAPLQPCPTPAQAPMIRGKVFRFKSALDDVTRPGWVPMARITYTDANVFSPNPANPPEQVDFVFGEGEEYEIVVMRVGTVAVYAILGDLNIETQEFVPRKMGIVRSVPVAPETITEGINIALDLPLTESTEIRLDQPPDQFPGPSLNAVFPFLNLESDGVIPFPPSAVFGTGRLLVTDLPPVAESEFYYMGGSFTQSANGGLTNPYSLTFVESSAPFRDGVDLGPFLQMPQNVTPKNGTLLRDGVLHWDKAGPIPDLASINVVDVRAVTGCCCLDQNMNGQCEPSDPPQCSGLPQQFNRWSLFGRGGQVSYALPRLPLGVTAFEAPNQYPWILQEAVAPRFDFDEWIYNQYSPFFWRSWAVSVFQFAVKEETD